MEAAREELVEISLDIHSHPELNYEEYHSAALLTDALERHGFDVERGVGGVETAFRGVLSGGGGDGPTVALLAEYDALPEIGHGCGHNLIAISNLGAGLGVKAALSSLPGRIVVLGTPAEERDGGKIRLLEAGAFDDIDIALSSHPNSNLTTFDADTPLARDLEPGRGQTYFPVPRECRPRLLDARGGYQRTKRGHPPVHWYRRVTPALTA